MNIVNYVIFYAFFITETQKHVFYCTYISTWTGALQSAIDSPAP